jgi:hypothetical protein
MLTGHPQVPDVNAQPAGSVVHPCYGSVVYEQLGWRAGLPPFVQLSAGGIKYHHAGYLGSALNPLHIKDDASRADFRVEDVSLPEGIAGSRLDRRRRMLASLDELHRVVDKSAGSVADRNESYRQAYDLITSPTAKRAFRIDEEDQKLRERYGMFREGQATLLARRLVEAGVRFITVEFNGYDTHDKNFIELKDPLLPKLDQAYSALLEDLSQRGLLETTLVICMGEFGRTPKVLDQDPPGRQHWPQVFSSILAGCGIGGGQVYGKSDKTASAVESNPVRPEELAATIYHALGVPLNEPQNNTGISRPITTGKPIIELFG